MKYISLSFLLILLPTLCQAEKNLSSVLVISGGHNYEQEPFKEMWDSFADLKVHYAEHPNVNSLYATSEIEKYDVLIFYDMVQEITVEQQRDFIKLLKKGKGVVFLHHSLASFQDWDRFFDIVGGRYLLDEQTLMNTSHPPSTFQHDVSIPVHVAQKDHPITRGLKDWTLYDEVYGGIVVKPDVTLLLTTDHPASSREIAWCHEIYSSRIVTIQPGHDHHAYKDKNYRQLVYQAIVWAKNK